jgi:hypothetical protein
LFWFYWFFWLHWSSSLFGSLGFLVGWPFGFNGSSGSFGSSGPVNLGGWTSN